MALKDAASEGMTFPVDNFNGFGPLATLSNCLETPSGHWYHPREETHRFCGTPGKLGGMVKIQLNRGNGQPSATCVDYFYKVVETYACSSQTKWQWADKECCMSVGKLL